MLYGSVNSQSCYQFAVQLPLIKSNAVGVDSLVQQDLLNPLFTASALIPISASWDVTVILIRSLIVTALTDISATCEAKQYSTATTEIDHTDYYYQLNSERAIHL